MGSCVSLQKSSSASGSAVKLVAFNNKRDKLVTPASPLTDDVIIPPLLDGSPPIDSGIRDSDDKEDMFFDSRAWLDSDCEDDYLSVDGEFTPSRGTTPVHPKFSMETQTPHELTDPTDPKKRLVELFKETMDEEEQEVDDVAAAKARRTCLWLRTPVRSSAPASPRTVSETQHRRIRSAAHGCVPRLVSCSSFTERRRPP